MRKVAFRSVAGKIRHVKRLIQTADPALKGAVGFGAVGAGLGGYSEKKRLDAHTHSKKFKSQSPEKQEEFKKKSVRKIVGNSVRGAVRGALTGTLWFAGNSAQRHMGKAFRKARRSARSGQRYSGSHGSAGEARSARTKDVGTPEWLKGVKTKAEAKTKFREQAKIHHPDRGGSEEKMKKVNSEWNSFQKHRFNKLSHVLSGFIDELREIYK